MYYGTELIIDLHDCSTKKFNRAGLEIYFQQLCELIDMEREDLHFWDYADDPDAKELAPPHLQGTSAIQFITTSNVTIHTLDKLKKVFINVFSCKPFSVEIVTRFTEKYFKAEQIKTAIVERGKLD